MLGKVDEAILEELKKDSRRSNVEIAKKLKISEGTVRQRIAKMRKEGVIQNFTVVVATKTGFSAFVLVQSNPQVSTTEIVKKLEKISDIKNLYETAGEFDIVVNVVTISAEQFNYIVEKIRTTKGVKKTETLVILKIN